MDYDKEKYRKKREKVLGAKTWKGLSFNTISAIVSIVIFIGLSIILVPRAMNYVVTRNFDDVIYKLGTQEKWPNDVLVHVSGIKGVEETAVDKKGRRLVITFDRTVVETESFSSIFRNQNLEAILLNRMNHRQRVANLKEEENLEAL